MVDITVRGDASLDAPTLVDGLPGVGLAGKIAVDHLIEALGMDYYADVTGEGLAPVAFFEEADPELKAAVRLFAAPEHDLLALRSDVPVSAVNAPAFATDVADWLADRDGVAVSLSGLSANRDPDERPSVYGVATAAARDCLPEGVESPGESGMISGPSGALLAEAHERGLPALGFVVETDPRFPDPGGARALLEDGVSALLGTAIDTDPLVEQAEEIIEAREQLAQRMHQADRHESSQATGVGMYH